MEKKMIGIALSIMVLLTFGVVKDIVNTNKNELNNDSINIWMSSGFERAADMSINDLESVKIIQELTNTNLFFSSTLDSNGDLFETEFYQNEYDVYYSKFRNGFLEDAYSTDNIIDLRQYIDQMPNYKSLINKYPEIYAKTCNIECLYFPVITLNNNAFSITSMRKDWMEQVGVEGVQTFDEFSEMLIDQKNLFDQGLLENSGKYFVGYTGINENIENIYGSFNTGTGVYLKNENVVFGPSTIEYHNMLKTFSTMNSSNLLDQLHFTNDDSTLDKYVLSNMASSFQSNPWYTDRLEQYSCLNNDNIKFENVDYFTDSNGEYNNYINDNKDFLVLNKGYVISSKMDKDKINDFIKVVDFMYSEVGIELINSGDDLYQKKPDLMVIDNKYNLNTIEGKDIKLNNFDNDYSVDTFPNLLSREESDELNTLKNDLNSYVDDYTQKFIYGKLDVYSDYEWQSYLKGLNSTGLERYLELVTKSNEQANELKEVADGL